MITLHHCPGTRSMRTLWLLNELGVPFELRSYPFDKTLRSPEFLLLSPAGRVPALEIDGQAMFETGAIAEYLCERFPDAGLGRAPGDLDRMDFLTWIHFAETISVSCAVLTQQHIVIRDDAQRSTFLMNLEARRLAKSIAGVEGRLSTPVENRECLLTSGFSAADIGVGHAVWMARHFVKLDPFPETAAWLDRLMERPAFKASAPSPEDRLWPEPFYAPWPDPAFAPRKGQGAS